MTPKMEGYLNGYLRKEALQPLTMLKFIRSFTDKTRALGLAGAPKLRDRVNRFQDRMASWVPGAQRRMEARIADYRKGMEGLERNIDEAGARNKLTTFGQYIAHPETGPRMQARVRLHGRIKDAQSDRDWLTRDDGRSGLEKETTRALVTLMRP